MEIPKELLKKAQKIAAKSMQLIADDLAEEAKYAIESFYDDYTPLYYHRHYDNFRKRSYKRHYRNYYNKNFVGGIVFTPELMYDYYKAPTDWVATTVYAGYHGPASMQTPPRAPIMSPSPMDILLRKRDYIEKNIDHYIDKAQKVVG